MAKVFGPTILGKVISCLLPIANWKISSRYSLLTLSKYPVPLASPRSVNKSAIDSLPEIFHEIQSWGSAIAATRAAFSGSFFANQRTLLAVNAATNADPTAFAISELPPTSEFNSAASAADLVSFQRSAGRITSPFLSSATIPCCCPATAIAATPSKPPAIFIASWVALHQCAGSTSLPSGCGARPSRITWPL